MNKYIILLISAIVLLPAIASGQSKSYKIYDVFADRDGITNFSFSKNMLDAVNLDIGDDETGERKVIGDLNQVRFMSYNPQKGNLTGSDFLEKAAGFLPKPSYKKYEETDGETDNAEIWLLGKKKNYKECHLFISNDNNDGLHFVVSFYGDFKVKDMDGFKEMGKGFSGQE